MVVLPSGGLLPCMSIRLFLVDEFLQFSFSDEGLNLLFQIVAIPRNIKIGQFRKNVLYCFSVLIVDILKTNGLKSYDRSI